MQTSQVSNAANVLTSAPAPNKQADANGSAEPFGQVLSREVSQRNSTNDAARKDAGDAAPKQQPTKTSSASDAKSSAKASETKSAKDGKAADKAVADEESMDATSALPEELLSLVANLSELNGSPAPVADAQAVQAVPAAQDLQQAVAAPPLTAAAAALPDAKPADPAARTVTATDASMPVDTRPLAAPGAAVKPDDGALQVKSSASDARAGLPTAAAAAANATFKAEDLNASTAGQSSSAKTQDFAAAMTESINGTTNAMQPVGQQAGLQAVQQHGTNTAERLTPRVGTPAWDQALGQKVVWMVAGEQQSASLTLNPPDLGPLQVVLNVNNSQANATFIAAQPEVRQALEAALPKLRDMLGEAGIQLGQASVNSGAPNQQGSFEQQGSHAARGHGQSGNRETIGTEAQARVARVQPSSTGLGMVDTFA